MKTKLTVLVSGIIMFTVFLGMYLLPLVPPPSKDVDLKVVKVDGTWKVVLASDYTKTEVKVKKKDVIIWTADGTDVSFQFPDFLFDPVGADDSLHNGYTKFLKDGKTLKLKIKDNVTPGTYEYAVFCTSDGTFAIGGSPPKIIVE